ncbi:MULTISPECIES: YqaA family protein [Ferrimonas]|uniref:YqaA family protein n=1 Tax=Ferrimonas TaxID=44011 RepID=UPI0003FC6888|nr:MULTISPECIES: VTT domain-containing protein [Ferrimonas]USD38528.1 DedA family protein [Ferrimonas sp. SCSIO 43195]
MQRNKGASSLRRRSLAAFAFLEGLILPVPVELLLAPLCRARPRRCWYYATVTTLAAVVGGLVAYLAARWGMQVWVMPLVERWGYQEELRQTLGLFQQWGPWVLAVTGLTPIPYKLATLAAGASGISLLSFTVAALISRASRYYLVAWVARQTGRLPAHYAWIGWIILGLFLCAIIALF